MYTAVKHTHLMLVFISVVLFFFRFYKVKMVHQAASKWMKIVPHIVDTLLLVSAFTLCVLVEQYPLIVHWLTVKFVFVIGYIVFAFKAMKSFEQKKAIGFLSLSCVCLVIAAKIAITKGQI